MRYNQGESIRNHYDLISPYYRSLWGPHIHHGFWKGGRETPAEAQQLLTEELIARASIGPGLRILDVGCGIGGSSIYLARNLGAKVTGITLSPIQVEMARTAAESDGVDVSFRVMDAQNMSFAPDERFDCIWSIEAISHFHNKKEFFHRASNLLVPGGLIAMTDWFGKEGLSDSARTEYLEPIERGMLIELNTLENYLQIIHEAGTVVQETGNLSENVAQTWDFCLDIIQDRSLWQTAHELGEDFVHFLDSFAAMKRGYEAKALEYQLIISRKPGPARTESG